MATFKKKFGKYEVELDVWVEDDEPRSDCSVSYNNFHTSLACLEMTGELENIDTGNTHIVDPYTIRDIKTWAEKNGY